MKFGLFILFGFDTPQLAADCRVKSENLALEKCSSTKNQSGIEIQVEGQTQSLLAMTSGANKLTRKVTLFPFKYPVACCGDSLFFVETTNLHLKIPQRFSISPFTFFIFCGNGRFDKAKPAFSFENAGFSFRFN
ncbi:hypothetical protein [Abditibacterium utsteinense]|uniref:hypothetical protein n=1 Tax=Abditibacterium utsteinense TaxID=1960156 RepID=UPI000F461D6F|nr:hypothetical protein [Abditibacterium utsteinense]